MDSQRLHLRSTVVVNDDLLKQLPKVSPDFELELPTGAEARIVANKIIVGSGSTRGYHMKLVADTVTDHGGAGLDAELVNQTARPETNGRPGLALTVVAKELLGGAGRSVGQRGGKGKKGLDGNQIPRPPGSEPDPNPPNEPFPQGPPDQEGRDGEKGGPGFRGGDGGPVAITLLKPSTATGRWFGRGGLGGEGGDGGKGEDVFGELDGENGAPGDPGPRGSDVAATVRVTDFLGWLNAVQGSALVLGDWIRHREALALEAFRRGSVHTALAEHAEAMKLAGSTPSNDVPLAIHLPALARDHRTITGVARDAELVPDIDEYARVHAERAKSLAGVLPANGPMSGDAHARLLVLQDRLRTMVSPGSDLTEQENDLKGQADRILKLVNELAKRVTRTQDRLTSLLNPQDGSQPASPAINAAGVPLTAPAVVNALVTVVGSLAPGVVPAPPDGSPIWPVSPQQPFGFRPVGDQATLLPYDLDLLVHRSVRATGEKLFPSDIAGMRVGAAGLARLAEWGRVNTGQAGTDGKPVVVSFARVAFELRGATGDRGVLDLLIELTEVTHVWRLARARMEQILAGRATLEIQRALAAARAKPPLFPSLIGPADLLPAIRSILDGLAWHAERADRASQLLTFGLADPPSGTLTFYPDPPNLSGDLALQQSVLHSPDWEKDLEEQTSTSLPTSSFESIVSAVRLRDTKKPYNDYLKRGIPLVGLAPAPLRKVFTADQRPDVIKRFAETGEFWFDASLADLIGSTGQSPHAEARVVGFKVSIDFAVAGPGIDIPLRVTHTGLSMQRDMAGVTHRQTMLPAGVDVNVAPVADALSIGEISLNPPGLPPIKPINFAVYGRGAVASWLVTRQETITVLPDIGAITVEVLYEGIVPEATASLRSVAFAGAGLRVGGDAVLTVGLTGPAGPGGVQVQLTSSDPAAVAVPGTVVVPVGKASTTAIAKVLKPTGPRPPELTARTADGVTRRARPVVPKPVGATSAVSSVALVAPGQSGGIAAIAVVPTTPKAAGRLVATVSPPVGTVDNPEPVAVIHERRPDTLAAVRQAKVGHQPRSLAVDPKRRRIYVANNGNGSTSVSMLDADTLETLAERVVGLHVDVEVDSAAGLVYVSLFGAAKIMILSADDLSVKGEVVDPVRMRRPHGLAVFPNPGGDAMIYVARTVRGIEGQSEESAVSQIRRTAGGVHTLVRSLDLGPILTQPVDVAVDTVHKLIFVSCLGGNAIAPSLIVLEHPTMKELHRVPLFSGGRAVESRSGSGLVYVAGEAGLTIVDGRAGILTQKFPLGDAHLDKGLPFSIAVDQVTGTAYVGTRDHATLFRIDAPTNGSRVFW